MFLIPQFVLSPFSGALCDRFSRKAILSLSCLYRVIVVAAIIYCLKSITIGEIYGFSFALGIGAAFFYPAKMSALTNVVKSSQLKFGNALTTSIGAIALLLGAFIANYFITFGDKTAYMIVGGMYLAAAIFTGFISFIIPQQVQKSEKGRNDIKVAFNYLQKHKKALYLVLLSICLQFIVAVFSNGLNALITDYYKLEFSDLTYLRTILGVGIVLGMVSALYFARIMKTIHLFACGFIVLCIALVTAPLCRTLSAAWYWLIPIGMADAVVLVMLDTILQKITPDRMRGKIFGFQLTFNTLSFLAGTYIVANLVTINMEVL